MINKILLQIQYPNIQQQIQIMKQISKTQIEGIIKQKYHRNKQQLDLTLTHYPVSLCKLIFSHEKIHRQMLKILVLSHNDYEDIIVTTICQFNWPNLLELHLNNNNKITSHGIDILVKKKWPCLKYLNLNGCSIKSQGAETLLKKIECTTFVQLHLQCNNIGANGLKILWSIPVNKFSNISILSLKYNTIGTKGMKYLSKIQLANLTIVQLQNCQFTNQGIKIIAKCHWPLIQKLNIKKNYHNQTSYQLFGLWNMHKLKNIDLDYKKPKSQIKKSKQRFFGTFNDKISNQILLYTFLSTTWNQLTYNCIDLRDKIKNNYEWIKIIFQNRFIPPKYIKTNDTILKV